VSSNKILSYSNVSFRSIRPRRNRFRI